MPRHPRHALLRAALAVALGILVIASNIVGQITVVAPTVVPALPAGLLGPTMPGNDFATPTGFPAGGFWYAAAEPAVYAATATTVYRFALPAALVSWAWNGAGGGRIPCWDELMMWDGLRLLAISPRLYGATFELRTYRDPAWTGPPALAGGVCTQLKAAVFPSTRPVGYSFVMGGRFNPPGIFIVGAGAPLTPLPGLTAAMRLSTSTVSGDGWANISIEIPAGTQMQSIYTTPDNAQVLIADGDPVPGLPGAVIGPTVLSDRPVMDLNGTLVFRSQLSGAGVTAGLNDRGLFVGKTRETLQMIVRAGDPEPSGLLPPGNWLSTSLAISPRISPEGGHILWSGAVNGPGITATGTAATTGRNDSAIFVGSPGAWQILARRNDPAPSTAGAVFDTSFDGSAAYQATALNSGGVACFQATLALGDVIGGTNDRALFTGTPGNLQIVQREGDSVALPSGNHAIGSLGFNCALNRLGQILHDERLSTTIGTPPATTADESCVFLYTPGSGNALLVREGDQAPGMPAGARMGNPTIAQGFGELGQTAILTAMTGAVTPADDVAIFLGGVGTLAPVVREGDPAPGLPAGVAFGVANSIMSYSDYQNGSVAFYTTLTGAGVDVYNDQSIWLGRPGHLQPIAREGDPAPGFAGRPAFSSATFGDTTPVTGGGQGIAAGSVWLNGRGQIVFGGVKVTVVDGAGSTVYGGCTYCWDPVIGLQLVHAAGDVLALPGGAALTFGNIGGIQFPSGDGTALSLSNDGDFCHRVAIDLALNQVGSAILRGRMGPLVCGPSAASATLGGVQPMSFDAGAANADRIYAVIATSSGTRPGFAFGSAAIPLNVDWVTMESVGNLTSFPGVPWGNTLGVLDSSGRGAATFTMPAGFGMFAGMELDHAMVVLDPALNVQFVTAPCGCRLY